MREQAVSTQRSRARLETHLVYTWCYSDTAGPGRLKKKILQTAKFSLKFNPERDLKHNTMRIKMSPVSRRNQYHVQAGCIALALVIQVITVVIFTLQKDSLLPNALFHTTHRNVSETFPLEVTMDWWSDMYWIMIDLWSTAWIFYGLISLLERNIFHPESCNPEVDPPVFYSTWVLINILRLFSMAMWDRHFICGAVTLRWMLPVLSFYMLYISCTNLEKHKVWLSINNPAVITWTRYLTQNGLAAFACWTLLNALVGLGIVIKYNTGVPDPLVSTVVLTLITLCAITWLILQSFLLSKYLRHTFSVYAILIFGLGAMFTRGYRIHNLAANMVYCGFLMLLMTVLSVSHLMSECLRTEKSSSQVLEPRVTFVEAVSQPESIKQNKL